MADKTLHNTALFDRLTEGKLLPGDMDILTRWLGSEELEPQAAELILNQLKQSVDADQLTPEIIAKLEARLPLIFMEGNRRSAPVIPLFKRRWLGYAAALVVMIGLGTYFFIIRKQVQNESINTLATSGIKDVQPGKDGAVLTLADGSTVVLDSLGNGLVANQNGTQVLLRNGRLVYNAAGSAKNGVSYNTMATPKGRQFQMVLPDGSKVWLNAASSIRYPTAFAGKERKVEVTGEVYFEVAKNAAQPFRVKLTNATEIEVLGTHFNVNSYENEESINTTLLEGAVQVRNASGKIVLKPGQQARVAAQREIKVVSNVDVESVMAWKNGVFNFQDATLEQVMRQLERWYDIEVVYEGNIPKLEFIGKMGRDLTLVTVLSGLEKSNVHFRIEEGKRLVVLP